MYPGLDDGVIEEASLRSGAGRDRAGVPGGARPIPPAVFGLTKSLGRGAMGWSAPAWLARRRASGGGELAGPAGARRAFWRREGSSGSGRRVERRCSGARGNPVRRCRAEYLGSHRSARGWTGRTRWPRTRSPTTRAHPAFYLAWFGPGMVKVGITRESRTAARPLEGALSPGWGAGPLMGPGAGRSGRVRRSGCPTGSVRAQARTCGVSCPDGGTGDRGRGSARRRAGRGTGLPDSLERLPFEAVDHAGSFGLDGVGGRRRPGGARGWSTAGVVAGRLVAVVGPHLHLGTGPRGVGAGARLITGWVLVGADARGGWGCPSSLWGVAGCRTGCPEIGAGGLATRKAGRDAAGRVTVRTWPVLGAAWTSRDHRRPYGLHAGAGAPQGVGVLRLGRPADRHGVADRLPARTRTHRSPCCGRSGCSGSPRCSTRTGPVWRPG